MSSAPPAETAAPAPTSPLLGPIAHLGLADDDAVLFSATVGDAPAVLHIPTRDAPQAWKDSVAFAKLAGLLGVPVVPETVARCVPYAALATAAEGHARDALRERSVIAPMGCVMLAVIAAPARAKPLSLVSSFEEQHLARALAGDDPLRPNEVAEARDLVAIRVLDYVAGNVFRRDAELTDDGRLVLLDNRFAVADHVLPISANVLFDRVKAIARFPRSLERAIAALDEVALTRALQEGPYEDHLVTTRPLREMVLRARAVATVIAARREERGDQSLLPEP